MGYAVAAGLLPAPSLVLGVAYYRSHEFASTATKKTLHSKHTDGFEYGQSGLPIELEKFFASRRLQHGAEWGAIIDSYLPAELRLSNEVSPEPQSTSVPRQSINILPQVLAKAREQSKIDLLSYVGIYQGRWEAVIWLVKAMMENYTGRGHREEQQERLSYMLWPNHGENLDELTMEPIQVESPGVSRISLESLMNDNMNESDDPVVLLEHRSLAQIWQSLGNMILQAADRSPNDPKYNLTMTQVFRILGHLHRIDAFPDAIYNYASPADHTVLQRPPTLYLLSKRIMSTLSDVEFDLQWKQEVLKYQQQGYEISNTSVTPRIREFGPELWLDLVLWACVEGGWISEAAWVIGEMERRKASRRTQWSVISWQQICTRKAPEIDWPSILRLQIDRTRLNQVGGIGIATGSDSTMDMGTRTISREVVLAVMDGLLNIRVIGPNASFGTVQQSIINCKNLLQRDHPALETNLLNAFVLRLIETTGLDERESPGVLQQILDIRSTTGKSAVTTEPSSSIHNLDADDTAATLGLLHRNLCTFAEKGNLQGSLIAFRKIQSIIDTKRDQHIQSFASELKLRLSRGDHCDDLIDDRELDSAAAFSPQMPVSTLIAFLDLITESKSYDLGRWLLENEDSDGGVVDPELYSDRNLQPALLRFATATADDNLLTKILAKIEPPIPQPVLHALLRCQIAMGKWPAVQKLLEHFQDTPGMSWKASDAMAIARAILQLENSSSDAQTAEQMCQAQELLTNVLHGKYNSPRDPSQPPDLSETKLANQLGRILKTLPISTLIKNLVPEYTPQAFNRAHTSVSITPNAFNILLETIVEISGPSAGKILWERWCREPGESPPKSSPIIEYSDGRGIWTRPFFSGGSSGSTPENESEERVVTPTRYMLRNILRPILRARKQRVQSSKPSNQEMRVTNTPANNVATSPDNSPPKASSNGGEGEESSTSEHPVKNALTSEEQAVLDWGVGMYRKFGLSDRESNAEIPGAVRRMKGEETR